MNPVQIMSLMDEFSVENPAHDNPPVGGRAVLGVAAGLGVATLAGAAWSRLQRKTWKVNQIGARDVRLKLAGGYLVAATIGAGIAARPGTRRAAVVGTVLGAAAAQVPLLIDPHLIRRHPVLGNIWQYGVPIGSALLGINAVS